MGNGLKFLKSRVTTSAIHKGYKGVIKRMRRRFSEERFLNAKNPNQQAS